MFLLRLEGPLDSFFAQITSTLLLASPLLFPVRSRKSLAGALLAATRNQVDFEQCLRLARPPLLLLLPLCIRCLARLSRQLLADRCNRCKTDRVQRKPSHSEVHHVSLVVRSMHVRSNVLPPLF
jgi:hypothetical protein